MRKVIDHTEVQEPKYKLYCFYKYDKNVRIIIAACSCLEAIDVLKETYENAYNTYNVLEHQVYEVDNDYLIKICNIDKDYIGYPIFISEDKFKDLMIHIDNLEFANMHHNKVLTKNILNKLKDKLNA